MSGAVTEKKEDKSAVLRTGEPRGRVEVINGMDKAMEIGTRGIVPL